MKTTFIASGDSFITRRIPNDGYEGFDELKCLIEAHDVRFANLESTFHDQEGAPAATSGGTWAMSDPVLLDDMNRYGFNLFNTVRRTITPATLDRAGLLPQSSISKSAA